MHPHILMELARIRSETLIDEARRTALASQLRKRRRARYRPKPEAGRCLLCDRLPCACPVAT